MLIIALILLFLLLIFYQVINDINKQKEITKTAQKLNKIMDFEKNKNEYEEYIKKEKDKN